MFRAKSEAVAEKIAWDMQAACDNENIGYDQYQRNTLYNEAEKVGFNCAKVTTKCETDCSALVRVCCAYAGVMLPDFNTEAEPRILLNSGAFDELKGSKYTDSPDMLKRGDILVTSVKGHTEVVLNDGNSTDDTLRKGDKGEDVKKMQQMLISLNYNLGRWGADGDFGSATESAVKEFQANNGIYVDGVVGPKTRTALNAAVNKRYSVVVNN